MRFYEWYMLDGESYNPPTATVPANYTIPFVSVIVTSPTEATIVSGTPTTTPLSYSGTASTEANFSGFSAIDHRPFTDTDGIVFLTGLLPGIKYYLRVRAHSGTSGSGTYGEYIYDTFTMPRAANVGGVTSTTSGTTTPKTTTTDEQSQSQIKKILDQQTADAEDKLDINLANSLPADVGSSYAAYGNRQIQRSYFKVTNSNKDKNKYSVEIKNTNISTSYKRYSFGAGILFSSVLKVPEASGGIGFFLDSVGKNGYFVELQTDASNKDLKDKSLKIYKVVNGKRIPLTDSQDTESGRLLGGIITSTLYKLDIDVIIETGATVINVYANNFLVTAVDAETPGQTNPQKKVISPTSRIALFSSLSSVNFDYVYANPVSATQITDAASRGNYNGQYADATLKFLFGEKIAEDFNSPTNKLAYLEEFGPTVRELRYVKANFSQPAAIPLYASTGVNKFATVLGSKFSNHGAEIFVINNSGSFIPLATGNEQKFFVVGNYVDISSQHEYTETSTNEYTVLEPATFQSTWIQSEADAKSLFTWIKNQWSKQQQSINMEIFGNPAIEVGDVINITYAKNSLDGTQKFLVTNVNLSFDQGVSTSITARSIYS
jgi:hypothetical protein